MAILDMQKQAKKGRPIPIKEIAAEQSLSLSYLEQLSRMLVKAGIVKSVKGPGGGYIFAKDISQITLKEILQAVGENTEITKCGIEKSASCSVDKSAKCNSHNLWANLSAYMLEYLQYTTLKDIEEENFFYKEKTKYEFRSP